MEKLIVKNFGPIKEAEIDLTKYVVFIGDTSTGKSVLAKLISIFREFSNVLNNRVDNSEFLASFRDQLENYNIDFNCENSIIDYFDTDLHIRLFRNEVSVLNDSRKKMTLDDLEYFVKDKNIIESNEEMQIAIRSLSMRGQNIYIPAERILTSLVGASISGLWANNVALPNCFKDFAGKFEVARKRIRTKKYPEFDIAYFFNGHNQDFVRIGDNREIEVSLVQASSGIQSLIPLLLVLDFELLGGRIEPRLSFLIEEPELNLFPIKQKKLIDYIITGVNPTKYKVVITTHSPYVLSSLDTLMLAKNTFNEHLDLREKINSIVSEDKWIDYDDISVYEVKNDGKIYSIKNEEFRSIDTNAIDGVSDIISEEFDKLTELRYAQ
ncbi:AAA family ATPase [Flavobacterium lipolyticum]|uniref:ATP-binding protein n=1 Tax=Flavobacterium lipolyticum TaxID=2893754 RepID=A0ABS8M6C8_9FLAO|nr:AAA family ATPase [Flavobacterium sp. F-126]MCC9020392.1 ATP-binding protein [Flavobacterium sp. F-126]